MDPQHAAGLQAAKKTTELQELLKQAEEASPEGVSQVAEQLQALIQGTPIKEAFLESIGVPLSACGSTRLVHQVSGDGICRALQGAVLRAPCCGGLSLLASRQGNCGSPAVMHTAV